MISRECFVEKLYSVSFTLEKVLVLMAEDDIMVSGGVDMKILNFGSCNIDYVYSLDHIVKIGETQTVSGRETFPGGKGLNQSIAAARVVMQSGAAFVQLPCMGVVDAFAVSKPELEYWLKGKNAISDYLATNTIEAADSYAQGKIWSRIIWDVTAVAWLLNDDDKFMDSRIIATPIPTYDGYYAQNQNGLPMRYVYSIKRDVLMGDLFDKLTK